MGNSAVLYFDGRPRREPLWGWPPQTKEPVDL